MYAFWKIYVEEKRKEILKINDIALFVIYLNYKWVHIPPKVLPIGLLLDCRQILQYMMQTDPPMPWTVPMHIP
jgi:hypothetical protein